jgi:hypothetical protein
LLKLPNLDDRVYEQMVEEARKQIPSIYPSWTDENAHDPGITMLELFSWLTEMQQYYLDRITERSERKFLKLLGIRPKAAGASSTEVQFHEVARQAALPQGTRLLAGDQIFETEDPLLLVPAAPEKLIVRTSTGMTDYSSANEGRNVAFPAFGPRAHAGSVLHIGFGKPLPVEETVTMSVRLDENYPVRPVKDVLGERVPSAKVQWQVYVGGELGQESTEGWAELELVKDETNQLSGSGTLTFRLHAPMQATIVQPAVDKPRYWISCRVVEEGFELPPKIERLALNAVTVKHHHTMSVTELFDWHGEPDQAVVSSHYLAYFGRHQVQIRQENGAWAQWQEVSSLDSYGSEDLVYTLERREANKTVIIRFGDGTKGAVPAAGRSRVRLISYEPDFETKRKIGSGNGLAGQTIDYLPTPAIAAGVSLQTGSKDRSGTWQWHDWKQVDDFDSSGPEDRHYILDAEQGTIRFGDNERGRVPEKSDVPNMVLTAYRIGGGTAGNINAGMIDRFAEPWPDVYGVQPANRFAASGGSEPEALEQAKVRARLALQQPATAVTEKDVERVVKQTPGLRIARVKAIPLYCPGMRNYPVEKASGRLSVVVVPYSENPRPMPSKGFRETVRRHLDKYRLLSTEVDIIPPEYIQVSVNAVIIVEPHFKEEKMTILRELNRLLQPFDNSDGGTGWAFGRTVYKGDIYGVINRIQGVSYIQDVWISAEGRGFRKEPGGDIVLPPNGLVCSGEHDIELISAAEL